MYVFLCHRLFCSGRKHGSQPGDEILRWWDSISKVGKFQVCVRVYEPGTYNGIAVIDHGCALERSRCSYPGNAALLHEHCAVFDRRCFNGDDVSALEYHRLSPEP